MKRVLAVLFCSFLVVCAFGQEADAPFSEKKWERLTKRLDYSQSPKKEEPVQDLDDFESTEESGGYDDGGSISAPSGTSTIFEGAGMVFTIIVVALLVMLIIYMIANSRSNPTLEAQNMELEEIENIEERIHEVDLDELFTKFVKSEEYHIALRMSFLMIIKQLSELKLIKWEKQKTNWEYHTDLNDYDLRREFGQMIQVFERFWYGEIALSEPEFHATENQFAHFKNQLDELGK